MDSGLYLCDFYGKDKTGMTLVVFFCLYLLLEVA